MVHYRNRGDHSLTIDLSNARKNDRETTRNVLRTNALGPCPIKGILKETRRRRYENTEQKREREREEDRIGEDELCRGRGRCARKAGSLEPREMNEVYKKEARGKRS